MSCCETSSCPQSRISGPVFICRTSQGQGKPCSMGSQMITRDRFRNPVGDPHQIYRPIYLATTSFISSKKSSFIVFSEPEVWFHPSRANLRLCLKPRALSSVVHICRLVMSLHHDKGCPISWAPSHGADKTPKTNDASEYLSR